MRTNLTKLLRVAMGPGEGAPIVQQFDVGNITRPAWATDGYDFFGFPLLYDQTSRLFVLDPGDGTAVRIWVGVISSALRVSGGVFIDKEVSVEIFSPNSIIFVPGTQQNSSAGVGGTDGLLLSVASPDAPYCKVVSGYPSDPTRQSQAIVSAVNSPSDPLAPGDSGMWVRPLGRFFYLGGLQ